MLVDRGTVLDITDTHSQYWMWIMFMTSVDHLQPEMDTRLSIAHNRPVTQYLIPSQLINMSPKRIVHMHEVCQYDMPGDLRKLHNVRQDGGGECR